MTTIPARLQIDSHGRLYDPSGKTPISFNDPWPCRASAAGVTGRMDGCVLHTVDGSFESCIATFNTPPYDKSSDLIIAQDGRVHQMVPIGQGYETYHAFAANLRWYGIETEDKGHPGTPVSDAGLWAWAQCLEFLSAFAGFPCQVTDSCTGRGLAYHRMCHEWNLNAHSCPGATMTDMVRVSQRHDIVTRALLIRHGTPPGVMHAPAGQWTTVPGSHVQVEPARHDVVLQYRPVP